MINSLPPSPILSNAQEILVNDFLSHHPEATRDLALRFLIGRKFVPEKTENCYQSWKKMITENGWQNISINDVRRELKKEKIYLPGGRDRNGAELMIINAAKACKGRQSDILKLAYWTSLHLEKSRKTQAIGISIICNMEGMDWNSFDLSLMKKIITIFQDCCPLRVKNIILLKSPWWVDMAIRVMMPLMKEKMRERVSLVKEEMDLIRWMDVEEVPSQIGGLKHYNHRVWVKRELDKADAADAAVITDSVPQPTPSISNYSTVSIENLALKLREERERVLGEMDRKIYDRTEKLQKHLKILEDTPEAPLGLIRISRLCGDMDDMIEVNQLSNIRMKVFNK